MRGDQREPTPVGGASPRTPAASMELLWGAPLPRGRGPKPTVTLHQIVTAAVEVADRDGLASVSMRAVAEQLDLSAMALYRYVRGKDELVDLMIDAAIGEPPPFEGDTGGWRVRLDDWARETLAVFHRHPWFLHVASQRRAMGPNEIAWLEQGLQAASTTGLSEREMLEVVTLVNAFVRGAAAVAVSHAVAEQVDGTPRADWYEELGVLLLRVGDAARYPMLTRVLNNGGFSATEPIAGDAGFDFGLQRILDGIDRLVRASRR